MDPLAPSSGAQSRDGTRIETQTILTANTKQVGDGINDSLAQSAADVGILLSINEMSMTSAADIVFMSKDLRSLPVLFLIAKSVIAQAKLNVLWAIVYNLLVLSLAMGLLEPWGLTITA